MPPASYRTACGVQRRLSMIRCLVPVAGPPKVGGRPGPESGSATKVRVDEPSDLGGQVLVLRCTAETGVRHRLEHGQLRLDPGVAEPAVDQDGVREEQVSDAALHERRRETGEVAEQRAQVRLRQGRARRGDSCSATPPRAVSRSISVRSSSARTVWLSAQTKSCWGSRVGTASFLGGCARSGRARVGRRGTRGTAAGSRRGAGGRARTRTCRGSRVGTASFLGGCVARQT